MAVTAQSQLEPPCVSDRAPEAGFVSKISFLACTNMTTAVIVSQCVLVAWMIECVVRGALVKLFNVYSCKVPNMESLEPVSGFIYKTMNRSLGLVIKSLCLVTCGNGVSGISAQVH